MIPKTSANEDKKAKIKILIKKTVKYRTFILNKLFSKRFIFKSLILIEMIK